MRKRATVRSVEPNGSIVMWLAGLVLGISAGLLITYHLLLSSRAAPLPLAMAGTAPAGLVRAGASSTHSVHREALRDAAARRAS